MGLFSSLLPAAGTIAGGLVGGPIGASIGGAIGSGIGGHFDQRSADKRSRKSQEEINRYFNDTSEIGHRYYDPYVNQGLEASGRVNQEYDSLLNDPTGFINQIMASYKPSEGYQFKENHLKRGAANTAAAGGFAGTQYDTENQAALINALLSDDMQQYLTNVTGAHGAGLAGKQGIADRGYNASSSLADFLGQNSANKADLAFYGNRQRNSDQNSFNNALLNLGGQVGGTLWNQNTPGRIWDGRPTPATSSTGPVRGGYGGPYQSSVPGAAWMR